MMKPLFNCLRLVLPAACLLAPGWAAEGGPATVENLPPVLFLAPTGEPRAAGPYVYEQRPYGPGRVALVAPERAREIVEQFRATYEKLGRPRVLIHVNQDVSPAAAPAPAAAGSAEVRLDEQGREVGGGAAPVTTSRLPDRQTVREVERLFGRPLRLAGASLADQRVAFQLMADRPLDQFTRSGNDSAARQDREALRRVADVVLEVLISSREVSVATVSGDRIVQVPDIQVTAIRLEDARIIGQAASTDVLGTGPAAAHLARRVDVREVAEATALALMQDLMIPAPPAG